MVLIHKKIFKTWWLVQDKINESVGLVPHYLGPNIPRDLVFVYSINVLVIFFIQLFLLFWPAWVHLITIFQLVDFNYHTFWWYFLLFYRCLNVVKSRFCWHVLLCLCARQWWEMTHLSSGDCFFSMGLLLCSLCEPFLLEA